MKQRIDSLLLPHIVDKYQCLESDLIINQGAIPGKSYISIIVPNRLYIINPTTRKIILTRVIQNKKEEKHVNQGLSMLKNHIALYQEELTDDDNQIYKVFDLKHRLITCLILQSIQQGQSFSAVTHSQDTQFTFSENTNELILYDLNTLSPLPLQLQKEQRLAEESQLMGSVQTETIILPESIRQRIVQVSQQNGLIQKGEDLHNIFKFMVSKVVNIEIIETFQMNILAGFKQQNQLSIQAIVFYDTKNKQFQDICIVNRLGEVFHNYHPFILGHSPTKQEILWKSEYLHEQKRKIKYLSHSQFISFDQQDISNKIIEMKSQLPEEEQPSLMVGGNLLYYYCSKNTLKQVILHESKQKELSFRVLSTGYFQDEDQEIVQKEYGVSFFKKFSETQTRRNRINKGLSADITTPKRQGELFLFTKVNAIKSGKLMKICLVVDDFIDIIFG